MKIKLKKIKEDEEYVYATGGFKFKKSAKQKNGHYRITAEKFLKQLDVPITPDELIFNYAIGKNERKGISRILLKIKLLLTLKILKKLLTFKNSKK